MNFQVESQKTLQRIRQKLDFSSFSVANQREFCRRLDKHFEDLFSLYYEVYGWQYDFYYHLEQLSHGLLEAYTQRSPALKRRDRERQKDPRWFKSNKMLGMAVYVDLHGGDLKQLATRIAYFKDLGVSYLHLMPLYAVPEGDSDGGYAVSDYRKVNPKLGTIEDLDKLAKALNKAGICLVLDFVFNHTADDHQWALKAKQGDSRYQAYYYMFDDKSLTEKYEENLREIFPQVRRGNFSFDPESKKWVWTTFNNFQWDLNYSNPEVFNAITDEMLFLANLGCDVLRLDALAFIWKEMGTSCENQEKAHTLIKAFNACLQISAPAVYFKSEAIVHPDEVLKYVSTNECQLSYNPQLMALIWNSLATRKTRLISASLQKSGKVPSDCSWVNYVRCHDDIGWTFDDSVAESIGINPQHHRQFLNQFYTGSFKGSFANGVAFGENPSTGDCRVCGSLASLCGLENALDSEDKELIYLARKRIELVHAVILSFGGIPLLYAGDELGLLNEYAYKEDLSKKHDARWVHRIAVQNSQLKNSPHPQVTDAIKHLIQVRANADILGDSDTEVLDSPNQHCFIFVRKSQEQKLLCIFNFSEHQLELPSEFLVKNLASVGFDLLSQNTFDLEQNIRLSAYEKLWLLANN